MAWGDGRSAHAERKAHFIGAATTLFFDAKGRLMSTRIGELSAATLNEKLQTLTQ